MDLKDVCAYPRPPALATTRETGRAHCFPKGSSKCFWYEAGICYANEPGNHRYPHAAGRDRVRSHWTEASYPSEWVDSDMIRKCTEEGWRTRAPTSRCLEDLSACNDFEVAVLCTPSRSDSTECSLDETESDSDGW